MAYFTYNNFQDFNTWLQVSHSHYNEEYLEERGRTGYKCRVVLRFSDPEMSMLTGNGEGRSKK